MWKKQFLNENLCALQVSLCALISQPLCARTPAQLKGNISQQQIVYFWDLQEVINIIYTVCFIKQGTLLNINKR